MLTASWPRAAKVSWLTRETNAAARKLYGAIAERTGFIQCRRLLAR